VAAVTAHLDQLLTTMLLMGFCVFMFAIWTMGALQNEHWGDENINCQSLYNCFMYSLSYGMRAGGGMGDNMNVINHEHPDFYTRVMFDMCFFMLINIIFLNIIFGIIVDTFSQMRDEFDQRKLDTTDNCFVCGLDRGDFGKGGKNFNTHIEKHHDPWKYVYFLYYMSEKREDELSGLEQAVLYSFSRLNTDWVPIGSTLFLDKDDDDDELKAVMKSIEGLGTEINTLKTMNTE